MARFPFKYKVVDQLGHIITGASVVVTLTGTSTAATIYVSEAGAVISNNTVTSDTSGDIEFWIDDGDYADPQRFRLSMSKTGFVTKTIDDVDIIRGNVTTNGTQTLTNKTLTTPTIADLTNMTHDHSNAAGGGTLGNYIFHATQSSDQTINDDTETKINFDAESLDTGTLFNLSTDSATLTAGRWLLVGQVGWLNIEASGASSDNFVRCVIYKNDTTVVNYGNKAYLEKGSSTQDPNSNVVAVVNANGTDTYQLYGHYNGNAATEDTNGAATDTYFMGFKIAE